MAIKKFLNGKIVDMTPEEETEFLKDQEEGQAGNITGNFTMYGIKV